MRGANGYSGPVTHWWQQSFMYTGAGLDWRYEGIIIGYLTLWRRTGVYRWLQKAKRAGDDLLNGQRADSHFTHSGFERNRSTAGTPHEAACCVGLLTLANALRQQSDASWQRYANCARRNLEQFHIEKLWDADSKSFRDDPTRPSFVPNKAATMSEALFLLAELTGDCVWVEQYARPNLEKIVAHQTPNGGIIQNSFGAQQIHIFFPIYIARCIPALLRGYDWFGQTQFLSSALAAMRFIARWQRSDGTLPTAIYANGQTNRFPSWIAGLGDVLNSAELLRPHGFTSDFSPLHTRLLAGQDATGGIQTASGFAAAAGGSPPPLPDIRDVLHVAGWNDKAFRYLTRWCDDADLPTDDSNRALGAFEQMCCFRGKHVLFCESAEMVEITHQHRPVYRWHKGRPTPEIASPDFWLR